MIKRPELTRKQDILHFVFITAGWIIYALLAYYVLSDITIKPLWILLPYVILFFSLLFFVNLWSRKQKETYDDYNQKHHRHPKTLAYKKDWLGYAVQMDEERIKEAQSILIETHEKIDDKKMVKTYLIGARYDNNE